MHHPLNADDHSTNSNESQVLRQRSSSGLNAHSYGHLAEQGSFSGDFRVPMENNIERVDGLSLHCSPIRNDHDRPGGFDTIPLTPAMHGPGGSSGSFYAASAGLGTGIDQRYLSRPECCRIESGGSVRSAASSTTVVSCGSATGKPGQKPGFQASSLGAVEKFTRKWPKPLPLKVPGKMRSIDDDLDLSDAELRELVDSAILEGRKSGIEGFHRWTRFKWCLLFSVFSVLVYGVAGMGCAVMTWFRVWKNADVMYVADNDILILITLASSILIFTALTGLTGTLLSSRTILTIYALFLWSALISLCAIGYTAYKRVTFSLDHKLDMAWSQYYTPLGRLMIQNSLGCCGWSGPLHEGTPSPLCFPRTGFPGCKGLLMRFEQDNLALVWVTVFSLVPMHLVNVIVVMLCANHVTKDFGNGITPRRYRLTAEDVMEDSERILELMRRNGESAGADVIVGGIARPGLIRASTSVLFREDREEKLGLLDVYYDEAAERYGCGHRYG